MCDKIRRWSLLAICILMLSGCGGGTEEVQPQNAQEKDGQTDTGFMLTGPGSYDSADTAMIVKINTQESTISLYNLTVSKKYTLNYDGATAFYDKYGEALSLAQIEEGDIVDVTFLKSKKRLNTLRESSESWTVASVEKYEINTARQEVTVGEDIYKITSDTHIFSAGQQIELMDLNSADVLTFRGIGSSVYGIVVERGHGYLRLSNDAGFIGGWIEVGQNIIHQISEDMLLTVPEGSYEVLISYKGSSGVKNAVVNRNEEVTLDIGDIEIKETQYGDVIFATTPSDARIYVDGEKVDTSGPVNLEYGIHQLIAIAEGYSSITTYLRVAQPSAGVEITMESETGQETDDETESKDGNGETDNPTTASTYYKVYIDEPEGAEVYVNGNYVGIAPTNFKKAQGAQVITLRKTGYETRSYTIQVDEEDKDVSYSFAELTAAVDD